MTDLENFEPPLRDKETLEREKLALEIKALDKPWYWSKGYWALAVPVALAVIASVIDSASGLKQSQAQNELLAEQIKWAQIDVRAATEAKNKAEAAHVEAKNAFDALIVEKLTIEEQKNNLRRERDALVAEKEELLTQVEKIQADEKFARNALAEKAEEAKREAERAAEAEKNAAFADQARLATEARIAREKQAEAKRILEEAKARSDAAAAAKAERDRAQKVQQAAEAEAVRREIERLNAQANERLKTTPTIYYDRQRGMGGIVYQPN